MQRILHTPEGVRDIHSSACAQKLALQDKLHSVIRSYGYQDIETPTFEYFDVFGREVGTTPSRELYKFFDRDGNTLVLRPDFTPAIARAASRYFLNEPAAIRLTYLGNAYINSSSYQGRLRETTQIGGELIGDDSADADAEIIALVAQILLASGLQEFQISLGHIGFFQSLVREAGFDAETEAELKRLIKNKNTFGVEKLLATQEVPEPLGRLFASLTSLFGTEEVLDLAEAMTSNEEALQALSRLRRILRILKMYGVDQYISFDLGLVSGYRYYTGIFFRGYTFGTGDAIIKGGRYDGLLGKFGKEAPAVGFVAEIDQLLNALERQHIEQQLPASQCMILYEPDQLEEAIRRATELRARGILVGLLRIAETRTRSECRSYAESQGCMLVVEL